MASYRRQSPVQWQPDGPQAVWGEVDDMSVVRRYADPAQEAASVASLALCDVSVLRKLGVKGAGAAQWLADRGLNVPGEVHDWCPAVQRQWQSGSYQAR